MTVKIGKHLYGDKIFYRVKANVSTEGGGSKSKIFWAQERIEKKSKIGSLLYVQCNKFGQYRWKGNCKQIEVVMAQSEDIIYEKKARMNLHYGELEVIKETK